MVFDILEFVNRAKAAGVNQEFAEYQARQFEQVIDIAVAQAKEEFGARDLATKSDIADIRKDLQIALKDQEIRLIKWFTGIGITTLLTLGGMLAKGFHWF